MNWIKEHYDLLFSGGVVAAVLSGIGYLVKTYILKQKEAQIKGPDTSNNIVVNNNLNQLGQPTLKENTGGSISIPEEQISKLQILTNILFIDDDKKFQIVAILKNSGWQNTEIVKDIQSLSDPVVKRANILFVDVKGVGKAFNCADEGLDLALMLKKQYPEKKVVIYSAEANMFHEATRVADDILHKNASSYEFLHTIEEFSKQLFTR